MIYVRSLQILRTQKSAFVCTKKNSKISVAVFLKSKESFEYCLNLQALRDSSLDDTHTLLLAKTYLKREKT